VHAQHDLGIASNLTGIDCAQKHLKWARLVNLLAELAYCCEHKD
jgi:hypothetical protein